MIPSSWIPLLPVPTQTCAFRTHVPCLSGQTEALGEDAPKIVLGQESKPPRYLDAQVLVIPFFLKEMFLVLQHLSLSQFIRKEDSWIQFFPLG